MKPSISEQVKQARLAKGWSQAELARRVGLDRASLARIESGQRGASVDTLRRLVEALGLDPRDLLAADEAPDLAAEPIEPYGPDEVAQLMAARGFATRDEAVRAAVREALARARPRRDWRELLGAARGEGENPCPRFGDDDALWERS